MNVLGQILRDLPPELWPSLWLTLRLAIVVTLLLLCLSAPLAWWLCRTRWRGVVIVEALVSLPIVLPPTVLGFYLLALFAPNTPLGGFWLRITGDTLAFSFCGLVVGSVLYSLPYAVQPLLGAFRAVPHNVFDAAATLGARGWTIFWSIALPLSRRGVGIAAMLSFAHTVGEFGVVVMLGGSIPGKTRVASIALYDEVQKLNYTAAHTLAFVLLALSFIVLLAMISLQRRNERAE